ncbi:MAG TPA: alpha/beta hydrolase [Caulobacterales bacterium]|nr:alpha/beta hydrolase [Caulobacterales bacterium]
MTLWLLAAALAAAGVAFLLFRHGHAYTKRVEGLWPAHGRFIETNGARIHILEAGPSSAPRVLLIHGASANLRELWGPIGEPLSHDHRVIAMDRPGYGHSTRPRRGAERLSTQAAMAADILRATGGEPAIIVAHSLGCAVALRLALDAPALVKGLVLIAPASHPYPGKNVWWARLAATPLAGHVFSSAIVPWVGPGIAKSGIAVNFHPGAPPHGYYEDGGVGLIFRPRAFRASARDVVATKREFAAQAPLYPEIMAPAIVITAEKDKIVSPKLHARGLARDLPASELVIAPDAGHMPHRLRPDLVLAAIRRIASMVEAPADS